MECCCLMTMIWPLNASRGFVSISWASCYTEARGQTPAERRPRASRLVTDTDPAWRTESGPRGTTGARPAVFLWRRTRTAAAQAVCRGWLCRTPLTNRGRSGLWPACRWLPCTRCLEPRAVQSRWNVPSCRLTGTGWSWQSPEDVDADKSTQASREPLDVSVLARAVLGVY